MVLPFNINLNGAKEVVVDGDHKPSTFLDSLL